MSRASSRLRAKKLEVGSKDTAPTQSTSRGNAKAQPKRKKAELLATTEPTQQSAGPALARETPRSDSSRAKATQKRRKAEPLATTEPPQQSPVSAAQAKAPAIWAKVRGRRGHLKMVVEMPFDILLEIFQYVNVTDLLTLVRSSRALRRLLLDRSLALPVWKSAFAQGQPSPPPCPEDISLPCYANFLYGRECSGCNAVAKKLERMHMVLVSLCETCHTRNCEANIYSYSQPAQAQFGLSVAQVRAITPSTYLTAYTWKSESVKLKFGEYNFRREVFYRPAFDRHVVELARIQKAGQSISDYVKEQQRFILRRTALRRPIELWDKQRSDAKKMELEGRRDDRQAAVTQKMMQLGFEDVLKHRNEVPFGKIPGVRGIKPLTERDWQRVEPQIVKTFTELRAKNLRQDMIRALSSRTLIMAELMKYSVSHNRDLEPYAPSGKSRQLAKMEPFKTLVYDTPPSEDLQLSDFLGLVDAIPEAIRSWKDAADTVLLGLLPNDSLETTIASKGKEKTLDPSILHLATTLFSCKRCTDTLCYPAVLHHSCLLRRKECDSDDEDSDFQSDLEEGAPEDPIEYQALWNEDAKQVQFDDLSSKFASAIITALNQDPKETTWLELDEQKGRVECRKCATRKTRLIMDWRGAITHGRAHHAKDAKKAIWKALDSASLEVAWAREDNYMLWRQCQFEEEYCVKCGMGRIEGGTDETASIRLLENLKPLTPGALQCMAGHDIVNTSSVYKCIPDGTEFDLYTPIKIPS